MHFRVLAFAAAALLCGCASNNAPTSVADLRSRDVFLPNGTRIRAEVMIEQTDLTRGMMFRTSLAPDRGMLFVHPVAGLWSYWMYQTLIPLDIIWMDDNHRIVEMSENTPPCKTAAHACPTYGGTKTSHYVLELHAGEAKKNGLQLGDTIRF